MGQTFSHLLPIRSKKPRNNPNKSRSQEVLPVGTEASIVKDDTSFSNNIIEEQRVATPDEQATTSWQETSQTGGTQKAYLWQPGHMEGQRLKEQYQTIKMLFDGQYHFGPTQQLTLQDAKILNVSCGDVNWAMDMAEEFPEAEIHIADIGGDCSASNLPNNIQVHIYDVDNPLPFPDNHFDYIHQAFMCMHIRKDDWPRIINEYVRVAKKDAVIELVDVDLYVNAPGPITDTITISVGFVMRSRGLAPTIARRMKQLLEESKVRDVSYEAVGIPLGDYGGPVGTRWKINYCHFLEEGFGKILNLDINEIRERQAQILREFEEFCSYQNICISYGFKQ